jgi:hypothetical protein
MGGEDQHAVHPNATIVHRIITTILRPRRRRELEHS